jgi:hypothetical protein
VSQSKLNPNGLSKKRILLSFKALGHDPELYMHPDEVERRVQLPAGHEQRLDVSDPRVRATTDSTLLATHISHVTVNYKATAWSSAGAKLATGIVSAVSGTSLTIGGTAVTISTIGAIEAGPS